MKKPVPSGYGKNPRHIYEGCSHVLVRPTTVYQMRTVRAGITPIVSVVLLLMLTVAVTGGAYVWVKDFVKESRDQTTARANTHLVFRGLHCDASNDELDFFLKNLGSREVDTGEVSIYVYDFSNDRLLEEVTTSRAAGDMEPGDSWDAIKAVVSTDIKEGKEYRIAFEFTQHVGGYTVSQRCEGD